MCAFKKECNKWDLMSLRRNFHYKWLSLQVDLYMIWKEQVFVVNVMVINLTCETMALNVISRSATAAAKLNTIAKIYFATPLLRSTSIESFMKGITLFQWPWKCTVHLGAMWIVSSSSLFYNRRSKDHYIFAINFSSSVLILFFNVL